MPEKEMPEESLDDESGVAHCVLLGENLLVGTLQMPKVKVVTAAGTTSVATGLLWRMERNESEEGAEPSFAIELVDESQMTGHFADAVLPIRAAGKLWQIPAHHVISYYQPKPEPHDAKEPAVEKPAVEKPAIEKPAVEKPAVEKPAPPSTNPFD